MFSHASIRTVLQISSFLVSVPVLEKHVKPSAGEHVWASDRPQLTVLGSVALEQLCNRRHFKPSEDLAPYIAVAWTMLWNLEEGQSFTLEVLPNPCVQIAMRDGRAAVLGVVTGSFSTTFTGRTFVFG